MNIEVMYFSRGGNTKKVAEAVAKAAGVSAKECSLGFDGAVDLLFLGSALYAFDLDENIKEFIESLDKTMIKKIALFSTSAMVKSVNDKMAKLIRAKGIDVLHESFYCRGEFSAAHKGRPNDEDLAAAAKFAAKAIEEAK